MLYKLANGTIKIFTVDATAGTTSEGSVSNPFFNDGGAVIFDAVYRNEGSGTNPDSWLIVGATKAVTVSTHIAFS